MTGVPEPGWVHITQSLTSLEQTHGLRPERILLCHLPKTLGGFLPHPLSFSSVNPALNPPRLFGALLPEYRAGICACVRGPLSPGSRQPGGSSPGCSRGLSIWEPHTPLQMWRTNLQGRWPQVCSPGRRLGVSLSCILHVLSRLLSARGNRDGRCRHVQLQEVHHPCTRVGKGRTLPPTQTRCPGGGISLSLGSDCRLV